MLLDIEAIDVHAHYGHYCRTEAPQLIRDFTSADSQAVLERARQARIETTIVSPLRGLMPRGTADAVAGNVEAAEVVAKTDGLLQWVVAHPFQPETFRQVDEMLRLPHCVGIKIHPEEHDYFIAEHGQRLFELAERHEAIVLAHSGDPRSLPADFVSFADAFPAVKLILAHLGNGGSASGDPTLQVRAVQACRHGNIYVDTSSARSLMPGLIEWAAGEIGADPILFGTDTPLYSAAMQRVRIDTAELDEQVKRSILRENAVRLFGIKGES